MTYRNGVLKCDRPFCPETLPRKDGEPRVSLFGRAFGLGWHIAPCVCEDQGSYWHKHDNCPVHFPLAAKAVETLPPL